jgi:DNA-binding MarR family transcriptional regulator
MTSRRVIQVRDWFIKLSGFRYRDISYRDIYLLFPDSGLVQRKSYRDIVFCDTLQVCNVGRVFLSTSQIVPLDKQLCFSIYATSIAINRTYKPMLDSMGITYPQYLVMNALGERDGSTIGAIASRLLLESSTITPPVKRLEQSGLVERRRSVTDERQVHVWLTDKGRDLLIESKCLGQLLIERAGLSEEQFGALNEQVRSLRDALNDDLQVPLEE